MSFDDYGLLIAQSLIANRASDAAATALAFYNGDAWQNATQWIGPCLSPGDPMYSRMISEVKRGHVSRNVIKEIVSRQTGGVLGRELHWKFSVDRPLGKSKTTDAVTGQTIIADKQPTGAEQALITEAEQALTKWWDKQEVPRTLQDMASLVALAKRAPLRLYVPPGARDAGGNIPTGDIAESLTRIYLQHLGTNEDTLDLQLPSATVYTDKKTRRAIGFFTYHEIVDTPAGQTEGSDQAELCYVNDNGETVLRIVGNGGDLEAMTLPLGGRLTLYEMTAPALIGPQIVSQQNLLNLALTMKARNVNLGGFLERVFLNTLPPGEYRVVDGVETYVRNETYNLGASSTNWLYGIKYKDALGNEQMTQPSVVYHDPVDVSTFEMTEQGAYLAILAEANQLHYALAGDAQVSAVSRVQARDAFEKALQELARSIEAAARWVLETALAMAAVFSGQPDRYAGLRAVVQARLDSGPIAAADKLAAIQIRDAGLWSIETAMSQTGIEDTDAEKERIEREQQGQQSADAANMAAVQAIMDKMNPVQNGNNQNGQPAMMNGQMGKVAA